MIIHSINIGWSLGIIIQQISPSPIQQQTVYFRKSGHIKLWLPLLVGPPRRLHWGFHWPPYRLHWGIHWPSCGLHPSDVLVLGGMVRNCSLLKNVRHILLRDGSLLVWGVLSLLVLGILSLLLVWGIGGSLLVSLLVLGDLLLGLSLWVIWGCLGGVRVRALRFLLLLSSILEWDLLSWINTYN